MYIGRWEDRQGCAGGTGRNCNSCMLLVISQSQLRCLMLLEVQISKSAWYSSQKYSYPVLTVSLTILTITPMIALRQISCYTIYIICNHYVIYGHSGDGGRAWSLVQQLSKSNKAMDSVSSWTCDFDVPLSLPCMHFQLDTIHVWSLFCEHSLIVRIVRHRSNVGGFKMATTHRLSIVHPE